MRVKTDMVTLLSETTTTDDIGQEIVSGTTERDVPCYVRSVSQTEQTNAQQRGYLAECRVDVFVLDYQGESLAEWQNKAYDIYRKYENDDRIELYLGTRIGDKDA